MVAPHEGGSSAYLIDQWGRTYPVTHEMSIGRRAEGHGLGIAFGTVSARHAKIQQRRDRWFLCDLGSTNGTSVNGTGLDETRALSHGDRVCVGDAVFYFAVDDSDNPNKEFKFLIYESQGPQKPTRVKKVEAQPRSIELLSLNRAEAGGVLKLGMITVTLPALQFEFVERLARQRERGPADGYVSVEEFASLNWYGATFNANQLRVLVHRFRQTLKAASIPRIVETGERDRGYRLDPDYVVTFEDAEDAEEVAEVSEVANQPPTRNTFDVIIEIVGERKVAVMKEVRMLANLTLKQAKALVEAAPAVVLVNVDKEKAAMAQRTLERAGAVVALK